MRTHLLAGLIAVSVLSGSGRLNADEKNQPIARLMTIGIDGSDPRVLLETADIQAPNWTPDGKWLICNGTLEGAKVLIRVATDGSTPATKIPTGDIKVSSNDHILSPDGKTIYITAKSHLYALPIEGGPPKRVTNDHPPGMAFKHFLHGVSPDGTTLAYVGVSKVGDDEWGRSDLYMIPATGGKDIQLTDTAAPDDGPEYSPDGKWIYFNSEINAKIPGHMQCYRMKPDGTGTEQLTHDERVNWFPHASPDGKWIVYLSFPPGTLKHPADKAVILRRMRPDGSEQSDILSFNGGQGTINVNSWSPDSKRFAFVMYPKSQDNAR